MTIGNLDLCCAWYGDQIAGSVNEKFKDKNKTDNHITKSIGVLQEDGVYAFFLYQASRGSEKEGKKSDEKLAVEELSARAMELLKDPRIAILPQTANEPLAAIQELADDLDKLLLAKQLLEQTLIYARYHAKAL